MCELGGPWPEGMSSRAQVALERLVEQVGELKGLEGMWEGEGPMQGCTPVRGKKGENGWLVNVKQDRDPRSYGDLGFPVGS